MKATTIYDLLAPAYGKVVPPFTELTVKRAVKRVAAGLPQNIVDLGVGTGRAFSELKKQSSARVTAVDISGKMLAMARKEAHLVGAEASMVQADVVRLPFQNGVFDAVLSTFLVNLIPNKMVPDALTEMVRVVAPGGRFVIGHLDVESTLLRSLWHLADEIVPDTFGIMRPINMNEFYEAAGMRIIREETVHEGLGTRVTTLMKVS
jgi:phosphatidylethanolamine/phosphatidyl-N-methylethanolamine N-methyltransferase